ncbi:indoleamine 2,3-dioxygenase 2-like [Corticium candelabrum]|uniref:indoleamine 2,3-dioxygenase 2-like n=1 Tax=Corticium candelabrum TaxID=121492 RepID=UPI002E2533E4|nr:indoleamine 2,3-dioxygenase 2-like [Corticium candelabrum]
MACLDPSAVPLLREYGVSETRGFVFDEDPALKLPSYFAQWDEISSQIPSLLSKSADVRDVINRMPLLDYTRLDKITDYRRAHAVLAVIGEAYVWCRGDSGVPPCLPQNIAIPWVGVSKYLGLPPVVTHFDVVLNNWRKIDVNGPLELSNLTTIYAFSPAGKDEQWFSLVTLQIELEAAPAVRCTVEAQRCVVEDDFETLIKCLQTIKHSVKKMQAVLLRMVEQCDYSVFYNQIRLFLAGWKGMKALPEGMLYEGVWEKPMQFVGGSAAQSSTIHCLSECLGIDYSCSDDGDESASHANFIAEMRDYMPRQHRDFLVALSRGPSVREYAKRLKLEGLTAEYNFCLATLEEFRSKHIQLVARYITVESRKGTSQDHDSLKETGTGGTGIMSFLKYIRDKTRQHVL